MQRAIVRIGSGLVAPRCLMDGGGSKDTRTDAWCYELVGRSVRGDGKRVEARQHTRRPVRARRLPAVQLDLGGQVPAVWPGDQCRKPEAMCASTFCRSGDSTTATANLQCDAPIQQQLRPTSSPPSLGRLRSSPVMSAPALLRRPGQLQLAGELSSQAAISPCSSRLRSSPIEWSLILMSDGRSASAAPKPLFRQPPPVPGVGCAAGGQDFHCRCLAHKYTQLCALP